MGKLQQASTNLNEADDLRELIHLSEQGLASLRTRADAILVLEACHEARELAGRLVEAHVDVRAEQGRLDTVIAKLEASAGRVVNLTGGAAAFHALRDSANGVSGEPPWNLDAVYAATIQKQLRALGIVVVVICLILGAGYAFRGTLFPPDPVGDAVNAAERALREGRDADAVKSIEAGIEITPTNAILLTWRGVLAERAGSPAAAGEAFASARAAARPPAFLFFVDRAQIYMRIGQADPALADLNVALAGNESRPELYYLRSIAYEMKSDRAAALDDLNRCASLAEAQGNDVLLATTRLRIGIMMGGGG